MRSFPYSNWIKGGLIIALIVSVGWGVSFAWNAWWHETDWIADGVVIEAKKLGESLQYLYERIPEVQDCPEGSIITRTRNGYQCITLPECEPGEVIRWEGDQFVCITPQTGNTCQLLRMTGRFVPGAFWYAPTPRYLSEQDLNSARMITMQDGQIISVSVSEATGDACISATTYFTFQCKNGVIGLLGIAQQTNYTNCSCFTADSLVTMADGTKKPIAQIQPGDVVLGKDGVQNTVRGLEKVPLAGRKLFSINGKKAFVTAEHPFLTTDGWKAIDPEALFAEEPRLAQTLAPQALQVGDVLITEDGLEEVRSIESQDAEEQTVYNLILDGNNTYYVDGYLVHNKGLGGGD